MTCIPIPAGSSTTGFGICSTKPFSIVVLAVEIAVFVWHRYSIYWWAGVNAGIKVITLHILTKAIAIPVITYPKTIVIAVTGRADAILIIINASNRCWSWGRGTTLAYRNHGRLTLRCTMQLVVLMLDRHFDISCLYRLYNHFTTLRFMTVHNGINTVRADICQSQCVS